MLDKLLLLKPVIDNLYKTTNIAVYKRSCPTSFEWEVIEVLYSILSGFISLLLYYKLSKILL